MTTIQKTYRIDEDLQKQTEYFLSEMGLNTTTAITMFFKRIVAEGKLPFTPEIIMSEERKKVREEILRLSEKIPVKKLDFNNPEDVKEFFDD